MLKAGKKLKYAKDDIAALVDSQFHKTLMALPTLGIFTFTVLPIIFMILVAFTNYDANHQSPTNLFTWVGLQNFRDLFSTANANYANSFGQVLLWTLIWAFFATFLNYFLGKYRGGNRKSFRNQDFRLSCTVIYRSRKLFGCDRLYGAGRSRGGSACF